MPTYDPQDAYNLITPQLGNVTLDATAKGILADNAYKYLWKLAPFRWERKSLSPAFAVVDDTNSYTATVPSDFWQILEASLIRTDVTPNQRWYLDIKTFIPIDKTSKVFPFYSIMFVPEANSGAGAYRIPNPAIGSGVTAQVDFAYRITPATKYTSANLTTDFVELPDQYFHVYCEVLLWMVYRFVGDSRVGQAQITKGGRVIYTGQMGIMQEAIYEMLQAEDYPSTDNIFPEEGMGDGSTTGCYISFP